MWRAETVGGLRLAALAQDDRVEVWLARLAGVEGPGDGEHEGDHEGEFGVGPAVVVQVDDAVEGPGGGAYGPYPCGAAHIFVGRGWARMDAGSL